MAGPVDYELIYEVYEESRLGKLASGAAMGAASLLGSTPSAMGDTTYNDAYQNHQVIQADEFAKLWSKYYHTGDEDYNTNRVKQVLDRGIDIPRNALDAIKTAVYVFGGDMGVTPNELETLLIYTGAAETDYKTRVQGKGGPARGYWQVEPATAADNLKNGKALLGRKFYKTFEKELKYIGEDYDMTRISEALEKSDRFAAAMAAMWWIRKAHKAI